MVGRKLWLLFPPEVTRDLLTADGGCHFDVLDDPDNAALRRALRACTTIVQQPGSSDGLGACARAMCERGFAGEALFVPSGWYHQVFNLVRGAAVGSSGN